MSATTVTAEGAGTRALRTTALALGLIVTGSTLLRIALNAFTSAPWIVPDEIIYAELAKSIVEGDPLTVRDGGRVALGPLYPLLISPAWALAADPAAAYRLALSINAVLMSVAAVPAYALARMFVSRRSALVVALFSVLVPSMAYTGVLMTENAFYPACLLVVLATARALQQPTFGRQMLVFGSIGLLTLVRVQGAALLGAYALAVLLRAVLLAERGSRRASLRAFTPSAALAAACLLAVPLAAVASGSGLLGWLGIYSGAFASVNVIEVPRWLVLHVADLVLYLAVVPAAATAIVLVLAFGRSAAPRVRLFAAVFIPVVTVMLALVVAVSAAIDVDGREVLNERYLFYVAPLALVGLALWIEEGLPRPRRATAIVAVAVSVLPALIPFDDLAYNANHQALAIVPWVLLEVPAVGAALLALSVAGLCTWIWVRARPAAASRLWMPVTVSALFVGALCVAAMASSSNRAHELGMGREAGWIDTVVPRGESAVVLWRDPPKGDRFRALASRVVMLNEFFNERVGTVYNVGGSAPTDAWLPTVPSRIDSAGLLVGTGGEPVHATYALALCDTGVLGAEVARDRATGAVLYRLPGVIRLEAGGKPCFGVYGRARGEPR